jgi:hypothetical protein
VAEEFFCSILQPHLPRLWRLPVTTTSTLLDLKAYRKSMNFILGFIVLIKLSMAAVRGWAKFGKAPRT